MLTLAKPRRGPIGLDIGSRSLRAVQLEQGPDGVRIAASVVLDRTEPGRAISRAEATRLAEVVDRQGFRGRHVVIAVPSARQLVGLLDLPPSVDGEDRHRLVGMEMARLHRCDPDVMEVAYWDLPVRGGDASRVMAAACAHADAGELLAVLEEAPSGFRVAAIDTHALALARACRAATGPGNAVIVEITHGRTFIVLVSRGCVAYERTLTDSGLDELIERICGRLHTSAEIAGHALRRVGLVASGTGDSRPLADDYVAITTDYFAAIAGEIETSLEYARRTMPNEADGALVLAGAGAEIPGIERWLSDRLGLNAGLADPGLTGAGRSTPSRSTGAAAMCAAVGLAMHEWDTDRPRVDLAPSRRIAEHRHRRRTRMWAGLCIGWAGLAAAGYAAAHSAWRPAGQDPALRLGEVRAQTERSLANAQWFEEQTQQAAQRLAAARAVERQPDWSVLLKVLAVKLPTGAALTDCELSPSRDRPRSEDVVAAMPSSRLLVGLSGTAATQQAVHEYVQNLEELELFNGIRILDTRREGGTDGQRVMFRVECELRDSAPEDE